MKHIKLYEDFVNEAAKIISFNFNSHKNHNPNVDILEGQIDRDSFITYIIYVNGPKKGEELMEHYVGSNYNVDSTKKSYSKIYSIDKIPSKYKAAWEELKAKYKSNYAN